MTHAPTHRFLAIAARMFHYLLPRRLDHCPGLQRHGSCSVDPTALMLAKPPCQPSWSPAAAVLTKKQRVRQALKMLVFCFLYRNPNLVFYEYFITKAETDLPRHSQECVTRILDRTWGITAGHAPLCRCSFAVPRWGRVRVSRYATKYYDQEDAGVT